MVSNSCGKFVSLLCLSCLVAAFLFPVECAAQILGLYGAENVGTSSGVFLRIPVGARAVGMGKAYTAIADDGSAIFWNPAGIMKTPGRKNFFASHSEYTADIALEYAALHTRRQNFGFGLMFGVLRSGDIERTDEFHSSNTGKYFNANQLFVGGTIARAMTDRFFIGGTIKYYVENLDEFQMRSVLADLGILYDVGWQEMSIGFSVRNFGSDLTPNGTPPPLLDGSFSSGDFQSYSAPTVGSFGTAKNWSISGNTGLITAIEFSHPSDARESFRFGGELSLNNVLKLRTGYETSRDEGGFSAGFGLQLNRKQLLFRFDYAYSDLGSFGTIHHFSVDLSPLVRRKSDDAWRGRQR